MTTFDRRTFLRLGGAALVVAGCGPVQGGVHHSPLQLRPSDKRGQAQRDWLDARHTFSFASYRDPDHMGFRSLRVLNEDRIAPGGGFPMHSHKDMEIITYVLGGTLEHKDSLGNGGIIQPGLVQHMTAGRGVRHSEFNPSDADATHLLQIWLRPDQVSHVPGYSQRQFSREERLNQLRLIVSGSGIDGSVAMHQDGRVFAGILEKGASVQHEVWSGRHVWIQVARGRVEANGLALGAGDGAFSSEPGRVDFRATEDAELLVFDLS